MTPEECAVRVVQQARVTVDNWFSADTVDALRLAIAEYDQALASRLSVWTNNQPSPASVQWPSVDRPCGLGHNPCEGRCSTQNDCSGDVRTYMVFDARGGCWGSFRYCETAKKSDEKSGFRLDPMV